jgi:WD40 repeat protein
VYDTGAWTRVLTLHGPRVINLAFDPTGRRLATGTAGGDASIWAIPSGVRVRHLREIGDPIDHVAFSSDGTIVVTASRDGTEQIWNAQSGGLQSQTNFLRGKILSIEFDPTSKLVLAASANGTVVVSDVLQGMPVAVFEGAASPVWVTHFDPRSRRIIGASFDGTARLWDAAPSYRRWNSLPVDDDCDTDESLEPDQRFIAISCRNHGTRVWDTARDQLLAELPSVTSVEGDFTSSFPAVSAAGDRAAIARGNAVEVYELPGSKLIRTITHRAPVNAVAFASTGHDVVSGAVDGSLLVARDGHEPITLPVSPDGIDVVTILADGRVVAAAGKRLRVYDPDHSTILADLAVGTRLRLFRQAPDGHRLLTLAIGARQASPLMLWDLERYRLVTPLDGHVGRIFSARFVAQGREILTAGGDGTARMWDETSGRLIQTYRSNSRFLVDATLSPDGSTVVAGGADGLLRFWDASGRALWVLQAHKSHVLAIHFEGDDIVTRGFAGDIARWTLPKPEQVIEGCNAREACAKMLK